MKWRRELEKLPLEDIKRELKNGKFVVFQVKTGYSAQGLRSALQDVFTGYPIYKFKSKFIIGRKTNKDKAPRELGNRDKYE